MRAWVWVGVLCLVACDDVRSAGDAGSDGGRAGLDASAERDAGRERVDARVLPPDSGGMEGIDAGEIDAGSIDAGEVDAATSDAGAADAGGSVDAGSTAPWALSMSTAPASDAITIGGVSVAPDGTCVAGGFGGTLRVDATRTLVSRGSYDVFVVCVDDRGGITSAWSFGGAGFDTAVEVARVGSDLVVAGRVAGDVVIDGATHGGGSDAFVARLSTSGALVWIARASGASSYAYDLAVDAARIAVVGTFGAFSGPAGTLSLGGRSVVGREREDAFVALLDHAGGVSHLASFGAELDEEASGVALGALGVVVTGTFESCALELGSGVSIDRVGGDADGLVLALDGSLAPRWVARVDGPGREDMGDVAIDAAGDVVLSGTFHSAVHLGGESLVAGTDFYAGLVASFASDGSLRWARRLGAVAAPFELAFDSGGQLFAAGSYDRAQPPLPAPMLADVVVHRLEPATGVLVAAAVLAQPGNQQPASFGVGDGIVAAGGGWVAELDALTPIEEPVVAPRDAWALRYGTQGVDAFDRVAITPSGDALVSGYYDNPSSLWTDFREEALVARVGADGVPRWTRSFGSTDAYVFDVASDAAGNAYAVGRVASAWCVGGALDRPTSQDAFVVSYAPDGALRWFRRISSTSASDQLANVIVTSTGRVVATGVYGGTELVVDGLRLENPGGVGLRAYAIGLDAADGSTEMLRGLAAGHPLDVAPDAAGGFVTSGGHRYTPGDLGYQGDSEGDAFVARYDPEGGEVWRYVAAHVDDTRSTTENDGFLGLTVGPSNVFVAGVVYGRLRFGEREIRSTRSQAIVVARFSLDGLFEDATVIEIADAHTASDIDVDASGHLYVVGRTWPGGQGFAASLGTDLTLREHWLTGVADLRGVDASAAPFVWVAGTFRGSAVLDGVTVADFDQPGLDPIEEAVLWHVPTPDVKRAPRGGGPARRAGGSGRRARWGTRSRRWAGQGSNLRPEVCKTSALPLSYPPGRTQRYARPRRAQSLGARITIGEPLDVPRAQRGQVLEADLRVQVMRDVVPDVARREHELVDPAQVMIVRRREDRREAAILGAHVVVLLQEAPRREQAGDRDRDHVAEEHLARRRDPRRDDERLEHALAELGATAVDDLARVGEVLARTVLQPDAPVDVARARPHDREQTDGHAQRPERDEHRAAQHVERVRQRAALEVRLEVRIAAHPAVAVMAQVVVAHRVHRRRDRVRAEHLEHAHHDVLVAHGHVRAVVHEDAERVQASRDEQREHRVAPPRRQEHRGPEHGEHRPLLERHAQEARARRGAQQLAWHRAARELRLAARRVERGLEIVDEVRVVQLGIVELGIVRAHRGTSSWSASESITSQYRT